MMLNDYTLPNKELRVTMEMRIEAENLGAQTSGTDSAHKGFKPQQFMVSLLIPFVDVDDLTRLIAVAKATQENGALVVYTITDELANALKVRRVRFTDSFYVREAPGLKAWNVQFSLVEFNSVSEKTEQRQKTATAQAQAAVGAVVSAEVEQASEGQELTWFEQQLAKLDKALA